MSERISNAQRRALRVMQEIGRPRGWGVYESRIPGVHWATSGALWRRGLVDADGITQRGREALE